MCIEEFNLTIFVPCRHTHAVRANLRQCFLSPINPNQLCANATPTFINITQVSNAHCFVCHPSVPQSQSSGTGPNNNNNINNATSAEEDSDDSHPPQELVDVLDDILNDPANDPANDPDHPSHDPLNDPLPGPVADALVAALTGPAPAAPAPAGPAPASISYEDALREVLDSIGEGDPDDFDFSIDLPASSGSQAGPGTNSQPSTAEDNNSADEPQSSGESSNSDGAPSPHDSLLDAEGETDPDYAEGGCHYIAPNGGASNSSSSDGDSSDANTPGEPDNANNTSSTSSSSSSSSPSSEDVGSVYEDSEGSEAGARADAEPVMTRSMTRAAANNAAAVADATGAANRPQGDGESEDADDEDSHASEDIYDASP